MLNLKNPELVPEPVKLAAGVLRDPEEFAKLLTIADIHGQLRALVYNPLQRLYLSARTRRDIILKPRQRGFSTLVQAEFTRYAFTRRVTTLTLMDKADNTNIMRRKINLMYERFPEHIDLGGGIVMERPGRDTSSELVTAFDTGAVMKMGTAGTLSAGRGDSLQCVHFSEVAYFKDAESNIAGAGEAGDPFWIVLESTANGARGHFYTLVKRALDGDPAWRLHFFPWFADTSCRLQLEPGEAEAYTYSDVEAELVLKHNLSPEQIAWRRAKVGTLRHLFPQEYPEDIEGAFLRSGIGYFGDPSFFCVLSPYQAQPQPGVRYAGGLDWGGGGNSSGETIDYTVLVIARADTGEQVALLRMRHEPYASIRAKIVGAARHWGLGVIVAEKNSMAGNVQSLREELSAARLSTGLREFTMTPESKRGLVTGLNDALERKALRLFNLPEVVSEFSAFVARQSPSGAWTYSGQAPEHDDIVIACGLAWIGVSLATGVSIARLE